MKTKKAVLVCSNAGLDYLDYPKDITILRSVIHFGTDESYDDFVELDAKTFYDRISKNPNDVPKTSYVSIGKMIDIFDSLKEKGYDEALVITIAGPLSGLNEAVRQQAKQVELKVTVFDSKTIAYGEAYQALEAYRLFEEGHDMDYVVSILEQIRDNNKIFFAVDTLLYLVKNGRLSVAGGFFGSLLKIKPLLSFDSDGRVVTLEKIRTTPKAQRKVFENYVEETKDKNVLTYISHAHNDEAVEFFKNEIKQVFPEREVITSYLTPVVGAHTGPKAIGLGYIDLDKIKY